MIKELSSRFSISFLCKYFQVSKSGYYAYHSRGLSKRNEENQKILKEIKVIYKDSKKRYGSPRITCALNKKGVECSRSKVERLMRVEGLKGLQAKSFKPKTTDSVHKKRVSDRIYDNDEVKPQKPNEVWVSDITYIPTKEGFVYLFMILDVFTRRIVGYKTCNDMKAENLIVAFLSAVKNSKESVKNLIFHSDQGSQFCDEEFRKTLRVLNVLQSMSRKGNCYDNAFAETFFHSMKAELEMTVFENKLKAKAQVEEYIEWYNAKRLHSSLDYMSPIEYENYITAA